MTQPQRWHCPLCKLTYTSPIPLQHPPNHNCHPSDRPMRNRKMERDDRVESLTTNPTVYAPIFEAPDV